MAGKKLNHALKRKKSILVLVMKISGYMNFSDGQVDFSCLVLKFCGRLSSLSVSILTGFLVSDFKEEH